MGNAGRNGGEYYTPRPLIRAMVKVVHQHLVNVSTTVHVVQLVSYVRLLTL